MTELKPCPFCGLRGYVRMIEDNMSIIPPEPAQVVCVNCSVHVIGRNMEEAVETWNKRAGDGSRGSHRGHPPLLLPLPAVRLQDTVRVSQIQCPAPLRHLREGAEKEDAYMTDLKTCPFCGCRVRIIVDVYGIHNQPDYVTVYHPENDCILSDTTGSWSSTDRDEIINAWNRRTKE